MEVLLGHVCLITYRIVPNKRPGCVAFFKQGVFESNVERENPYKIAIKA